MAAAGSDEPLSSTTSRRSTAVLVTVAGVLVAVVALVVGLVAPRVLDDGEPAEAREVLQRAEDFAITYNTYDVADIEEYQERMRPLLTDDYFTEFQRITDAVFQALESDEQSSGDARVLASAVDTIDGESAVALVAVNAAISTSAEEAAVQRRFRWKVTFERDGEDWRVSQFEQVVPVDAELGEPGEAGGLVPGTGEESTPEDGATPAPTPTEEEGE